jgi:chromosome segregation ATPase
MTQKFNRLDNALLEIDEKYGCVNDKIMNCLEDLKAKDKENEDKIEGLNREVRELKAFTKIDKNTIKSFTNVIATISSENVKIQSDLEQAEKHIDMMIEDDRYR